MPSDEQIMELEKRKEELKKELQEINKKLRYKKCNDYQRKEENLKYCECCDIKISKYAFEKHEKTDTHKLKYQLKDLSSRLK